MYSVCVRPARATLAAPNSLLAAGLSRAAHQAGLEVVDEGKAAELSIRCGDWGSANPNLDVAMDEKSAVVTVKLPIDPGVWEIVGRLLQGVGSGGTEIADSTPTQRKRVRMR
jgi:hypothetical protein